LATQKLFSAVLQSESPAHSTHVPLDVPLAEQTGLVADRAEQAVAAAVWQPVHALATQKLLAGSPQSLSPVHSTQVPAAVPLAEQTGLVAARAEHAVAGAVWQPAQVLAMQKLLVGPCSRCQQSTRRTCRRSLHWLSKRAWSPTAWSTP
jgi:hypothetical protein